LRFNQKAPKLYANRFLDKPMKIISNIKVYVHTLSESSIL